MVVIILLKVRIFRLMRISLSVLVFFWTYKNLIPLYYDVIEVYFRPYENTHHIVKTISIIKQTDIQPPEQDKEPHFYFISRKFNCLHQDVLVLLHVACSPVAQIISALRVLLSCLPFKELYIFFYHLQFWVSRAGIEFIIRIGKVARVNRTQFCSTYLVSRSCGWDSCPCLVFLLSYYSYMWSWLWLTHEDSSLLECEVVSLVISRLYAVSNLILISGK